MILKALNTGIKQRIKYDHMNFLEALLYELNMMFNIMGFTLYVKYLNGIAIEGKDFITLE